MLRSAATSAAATVASGASSPSTSIWRPRRPWVTRRRPDRRVLEERRVMDASTDEFKVLLDREKIRDCIAKLARGEDRRDARLITGCFWPDATVDLGIFAGSFDEYLALVVPGSPTIPVTQHVLGQ